MRVVISGSSGLIGRALTASLLGDGHEVLRLVRREPAASAEGARLREAQWNPAVGRLDGEVLEGADAVVGLGGAGVGDHRWTPEYRRELRDSRVFGAALLAEKIAALDNPPKAFLSSSAIGYYGDTRGIAVDETDGPGEDFLARLSVEWEQAADPAAAVTRVVYPRFGIVLGPGGGAFGKMLPLAKLGVLGPIGGGKQYWSVISLDDTIRALRFAIEHEELSGPVNITCPNPVTNGEFTRELGRTLRRPAFLPVPGLAVRLAVGGFAESILMSQQVIPAKLIGAGFAFRHAEPADALHALSRGRAPSR